MFLARSTPTETKKLLNSFTILETFVVLLPLIQNVLFWLELVVSLLIILLIIFQVFRRFSLCNSSSLL